MDWLEDLEAIVATWAIFYNPIMEDDLDWSPSPEVIDNIQKGEVALLEDVAILEEILLVARRHRARHPENHGMTEEQAVATRTMLRDVRALRQGVDIDRLPPLQPSKYSKRSA